MAGAGEALEATGLRERGPVPDDGDLSAAALRAPRHTGAGAYRPRRSSLPPPRLSGLSAGLFLPHRSTAPPGRG